MSVLVSAVLLWVKNNKTLALLIALALGIVMMVLGVTFVIKAIYDRGVSSGENKVVRDVQKDTLDRLERARRDKEKADEDVRNTPYRDRIDQLR